MIVGDVPPNEAELLAEDNSGEIGEDLLDEDEEQLGELSDQERSPQEAVAESQPPSKMSSVPTILFQTKRKQKSESKTN